MVFFTDDELSDFDRHFTSVLSICRSAAGLDEESPLNEPVRVCSADRSLLRLYDLHTGVFDCHDSDCENEAPLSGQ